MHFIMFEDRFHIGRSIAPLHRKNARSTSQAHALSQATWMMGSWRGSRRAESGVHHAEHE
jgi:hypothetical protein